MRLGVSVGFVWTNGTRSSFVCFLTLVCLVLVVVCVFAYVFVCFRCDVRQCGSDGCEFSAWKLDVVCEDVIPRFEHT